MVRSRHNIRKQQILACATLGAILDHKISIFSLLLDPFAGTHVYSLGSPTTIAMK
jgi:hypothetical protein